MIKHDSLGSFRCAWAYSERLAHRPSWFNEMKMFCCSSVAEPKLGQDSAVPQCTHDGEIVNVPGLFSLLVWDHIHDVYYTRIN